MKLSIRCMPGYQDTAKSGRKSEPLRALKKTPRRSLKRKKAINNEVDDLLIVGVPGYREEREKVRTLAGLEEDA
jgi:hypothetical protein